MVIKRTNLTVQQRHTQVVLRVWATLIGIGITPFTSGVPSGNGLSHTYDSAYDYVYKKTDRKECRYIWTATGTTTNCLNNLSVVHTQAVKCVEQPTGEVAQDVPVKKCGDNAAPSITHSQYDSTNIWNPALIDYGNHGGTNSTWSYPDFSLEPSANATATEIKYTKACAQSSYEWSSSDVCDTGTNQCVSNNRAGTTKTTFKCLDSGNNDAEVELSNCLDTTNNTVTGTPPTDTTNVNGSSTSYDESSTNPCSETCTPTYYSKITDGACLCKQGQALKTQTFECLENDANGNQATLKNCFSGSGNTITGTPPTPTQEGWIKNDKANGEFYKSYTKQDVSCTKTCTATSFYWKITPTPCVQGAAMCVAKSPGPGYEYTGKHTKTFECFDDAALTSPVELSNCLTGGSVTPDPTHGAPDPTEKSLLTSNNTKTSHTLTNLTCKEDCQKKFYWKIDDTATCQPTTGATCTKKGGLCVKDGTKDKTFSCFDDTARTSSVNISFCLDSNNTVIGAPAHGGSPTATEITDLNTLPTNVPSQQLTGVQCDANCPASQCGTVHCKVGTWQTKNETYTNLNTEAVEQECKAPDGSTGSGVLCFDKPSSTPTTNLIKQQPPLENHQIDRTSNTCSGGPSCNSSLVSQSCTRNESNKLGQFEPQCEFESATSASQNTKQEKLDLQCTIDPPRSTQLSCSYKVYKDVYGHHMWSAKLFWNTPCLCP